MADSFTMERFRARMMPPAPPAPRYVGEQRTPEQRAQLLMQSKTMAEIRIAATVLGLSFHDAYQERAQLWALAIRRNDFPTWVQVPPARSDAPP